MNLSLSQARAPTPTPNFAKFFDKSPKLAKNLQKNIEGKLPEPRAPPLSKDPGSAAESGDIHPSYAPDGSLGQLLR